VRRLGWGLAAVILCASWASHAQSTPEIDDGWTRIEGPNPTYVHQGTLFRCPADLPEGYAIARALTDNGNNEVACFYKSSDKGTVSFHWAQGLGRILDEIAYKERTFWAEMMPGVSPVAGELEWTIGGEKVKAAIFQVMTIAPATKQLLGMSLAIGAVEDRRIKANVLWLGSSAVSSRVTADFFALQTAAVANRKNCLAYGFWPTRTRARLSPNPSEAASSAALLLFSKTVEATGHQAPLPPAPPICQGTFGGGTDNEAIPLSQRTGVQDVRAVMSNGAEGDVIAALGARPAGLTSRVDRDSPYFLYGKQGKLIAIFRSYRALPSYAQVAADMVAVTNGQLEPIAVVSTDVAAGKIEISIDDAQVVAEKAKRRPGSE
jgi:hypothetical protein